MLTVEISLPEVEELQKLVQEGLEKGVLNYDEIANGLEDVELTKEQIEDFYTYLVDHGVELLEGETHKHPPHEQLPTPEEEKGPKLDLSVEASLDTRRASPLCASPSARSARSHSSPPTRRSTSRSASSAARWRRRRR